MRWASSAGTAWPLASSDWARRKAAASTLRSRGSAEDTPRASTGPWLGAMAAFALLVVSDVLCQRNAVMTQVLIQRFQVPLEYPVYFTRDTFAPDNLALVEAIRRLDPVRVQRCLFVVEERVAE